MSSDVLSSIMNQQVQQQVPTDINGQPTPNVSGEPSFADEYQAVQMKYEEPINELLAEIEKLENKLEKIDDPSSSEYKTIKKKLENAEMKLDQLYRQEDKELQEIENAQQQVGDQVEAENEMMGYNDEQMYQNPENIDTQNNEIPMMQKGGKLDPNNPLDRVKIWFKNNFGYQTDAVNNPSKKERYTIDKFSKDMQEFKDAYPALSIGFDMVNPVYTVMDTVNQMKLNHDENPNNKASVMTPLLWALAGSSIIGGIPAAFKSIKNMKTHRVWDPFYKAYKEWSFDPGIKNWPYNLIKGLNLGLDTVIRSGTKIVPSTLDKLFPLSRWTKEGTKFVKTFDNFFNQPTSIHRWFPVYSTEKPNNIVGKSFRVISNAGRTAIPIIGGKLYWNYHNENKANKKEKLQKETVIIPETEGFTTPIDTIVNEQSINDSVNNFGNKLIDTETGSPIRQAGGKINKFQSPTHEKIKWLEDFKKDYSQKHSTGLSGFLKETPYTEYGVWGNAIGKLLDNSGRMNIEAQNQFKYSDNPYTSVYDRMNREYNDQISATNKRYDLRENNIRRMIPSIEYKSLQQSQNARLAQQLLTNEQLSKNDTDRLSELSSLRSTTGKEVNEAYKNMMEKNYENTLLNENQRKSYLQALDTYHKEKQGQFDQLVNMSAITGNRRKQIDMFNSELFPNFINAAINGVDLNDLLKLYQQHYPYYIPEKNR